MIPFGDDVSVKSLTDLDFIGLGTRPALWVDGVLTAPTSSSFLGSIGAAALASPAFTGVPTAPTAAGGTNTTQLATTAFVRAEVAALIASAPGALDTLDELAAALGDDPNFATTVTNSIAGKVSKAGDTMTGELTMLNDALGITLYQGARFYKKSGTGIVTRLHSGNTRMQVENNAGTILGTYWDSGNLPFTWSSPTLTLGAGNTVSNPRFVLQHNSGVAGGSAFEVQGAGGASDENAGKYYWGNGFRLIGTTEPKWKFQTNASSVWTTVFEKASASMSDLGMRFYGHVILNNATASRAVVFDASKQLVPSATTSQQIGWLSNLASDVQVQINGKVGTNPWNSQTIASISAAGNFFADTEVGDVAVRFATTANKVRLGVFDGGPGLNKSSIWWGLNVVGFEGTVNFAAQIASRALVLDASKNVISSSTTATQIAYLDTLTGNVQTQLNGKPHKDDVNSGTTFDSTFDPLSDRFVSSSVFDLRGGVRTMFTYGPFSGSKMWYNVVDVRHRNGSADGATGYGGELVWGMTASQTRMAFRSRAVDGTPTAWAEVWTKADISEANMPRLNANQTWTGQNSFLIDNSFKANGFNYLSGALASGGFFAAPSTNGVASSEPYHGINFDTYGGATKVGLGVIPTNPVNTVSDGFYVQSNGVGTIPKAAMVGRDLEIKPTTVGYSGKLAIWGESFHSFDVAALQSVTTSNASMTGIRARITSSTARNVTLPDPANHSLAIVMVEEDAASGKHRIYPPSGSEIRWTDHTGTGRYSVASGIGAGSSFLVTRGMYWFVSDGGLWYALSVGSAT